MAANCSPRSAVTSLMVACFLALYVACEAQVTSAHGPTQLWQHGHVYRFVVTTKWWHSTAHRTADAVMVEEPFQPPVTDVNHGTKCTLLVQPVARERWHHGQSATPGRDDSSGGDSWLLRLRVATCSAITSRFHGPYVEAAGTEDFMSARLREDPTNSGADISRTFRQRIATPFFATLGDTGTLHRLHFYRNETLSTRNWKRGLIAFLSLRHDHHVVDEYVDAVDQDEHGVCVRLGGVLHAAGVDRVRASGTLQATKFKTVPTASPSSGECLIIACWRPSAIAANRRPTPASAYPRCGLGTSVARLPTSNAPMRAIFGWPKSRCVVPPVSIQRRSQPLRVERQLVWQRPLTGHGRRRRRSRPNLS